MLRFNRITPDRSKFQYSELRINYLDLIERTMATNAVEDLVVSTIKDAFSNVVLHD